MAQRWSMDTDALGRKALADALKTRVGLKAGFASQLANAHKRPSLDLALRIEELAGIPANLWGSPNRGAAMWEQIQKGEIK